MKIEEIRKILDAEWLGNRNSRADCNDIEILSCQASDLMSDVLTVSGENSILLTGLTNAQVIRVAEVSDLVAVCFVRGKRPQLEVIQLAEERDVPLLVTPLSMYESCGRLYAGGLPGGDRTKAKSK
jgi:hypothetical protein